MALRPDRRNLGFRRTSPNSAILSHQLTKCEASSTAMALALLTKISPAAWRYILLNGHYTFQSDDKMIDLDALVAGLELE